MEAGFSAGKTTADMPVMERQNATNATSFMVKEDKSELFGTRKDAGLNRRI